MKISTRARYGLRAILELADNYNQGLLTVKTIAEKQQISEAYLEQLMIQLVKSGLVKSIRGVQGGYYLAKNPSKILAGEVIRALEGPVAPVDCVNKENPSECCRSDICPTRTVWEKVRDVVDEALDSFTLEDLCRKRELNNENIL